MGTGLILDHLHYLTLVTEELITRVIYKHVIKYVTSLGTLSHVGFPVLMIWYETKMQLWKFRDFFMKVLDLP